MKISLIFIKAAFVVMAFYLLTAEPPLSARIADQARVHMNEAHYQQRGYYPAAHNYNPAGSGYRQGQVKGYEQGIQSGAASVNQANPVYVTPQQPVYSVYPGTPGAPGPGQ